MTTPVIPIELQEHVIDLIHDESYHNLTATLWNCALTCRSWLPRTRRRLYRRVEFHATLKKQGQLLVKVLHTSPEVADTVRELQISSDPEEELEDSQKRFDVRNVAPLIVLSGKLPCLTSLYIGHMLPHLPPARLPLMLAGFPTLTTLELRAMAFTSFVAFQRMLAASPRLRRLSATSLAWKSTQTSINVRCSQLPCPPLTHLTWEESMIVSAPAILR